MSIYRRDNIRYCKWRMQLWLLSHMQYTWKLEKTWWDEQFNVIWAYLSLLPNRHMLIRKCTQLIDNRTLSARHAHENCWMTAGEKRARFEYTGTRRIGIGFCLLAMVNGMMITYQTFANASALVDWTNRMPSATLLFVMSFCWSSNWNSG